MGDFILLKDDNLPRCDWHFCRVLEVYKSKDNKVRSAKLLVGSRDGTPGSVLNRPIHNMVFVLAGEIFFYLLRHAVFSRHIRCVYSVVIISC